MQVLIMSPINDKILHTVEQDEAKSMYNIGENFKKNCSKSMVDGVVIFAR
jgi:hypothetical protein